MQGVMIRRILMVLTAALLAWTQAAVAEYPESWCASSWRFRRAGPPTLWREP